MMNGNYIVVGIVMSFLALIYVPIPHVQGVAALILVYLVAMGATMKHYDDAEEEARAEVRTDRDAARHVATWTCGGIILFGLWVLLGVAILATMLG